MEAVLECVAQPVWVVDHDGLIEYVNPAGVTALGYDDLSELQGRPGHETIHYKHVDGSPFPASECPMSLSRATGETVEMDEDWFVRRDGSMFRVSYISRPIDTPSGPGLVVAFTDLEVAGARRRIMEAADAARAQLGRDLHDGAQQQFVCALLNLQVADRKDATDPAAARRLRDEAAELARTGLAELRRLAAGLNPALLAERGLGPAVEALAHRVPLPVAVLDVPADRLPEPIETSCFFFVAEALTNVVKHAQAHEAAVSIARANGGLLIEVRDDGVGGASEPTGGSGLRGLSDRIGALDGRIEVESPPGGGTMLRAHIPLSA